MKEFIKSRPALKQAVLARLIGWNASNFCLWMKGERPIPKEKEKLLKELLKDYGYQQTK